MNGHHQLQGATRRRWIVFGGLGAIGLVTFVLAHSKNKYDAYYSSSAAGASAVEGSVAQLTQECATAAPVKPEDHDRSWAFKNIFDTNEWSSPESKSGKGSEMRYTERVRKLIDYTIDKYNVKSFADAPCGDCAWQTHLRNFPHINYTGMDIVPELILGNSKKHAKYTNARFMNLDLVLDDLPAADTYMVRDVVQHLSLEDGVELIRNVERTGAKHLISNFHVLKKDGSPLANRNIEAGRFYPNNVMLEPFNFPKPLYYILDMHDGYFEKEGDGMGIKLAAVWELPVLNRGNGKAFNVNFDDARDLVFMKSEYE